MLKFETHYERDGFEMHNFLLKQMVTLVLALFSFALFADNLPVQTQIIQPQKLKMLIERSGKIDFRHKTKFSFKTSGYINFITADVGQVVAKGQVIAELETADLLAAQGSAQATYQQAAQDADRASTLYKNKKTVSKYELELAETALAQAQSALVQAQYNLDKAQIVVPFKAVIVNRFMQPQELASAGSVVIEAASLQPENLILRLDLTQHEIQLAQTNKPVDVFFDDGQIISGKILTIPATASVSGLYQIEVALPANSKIRVGQWLKARLQIFKPNLSYAIPLAALAKIDDGKAVLAVESNKSMQFQEFEILHFDAQFVYVAASDQPINLVVHGWDRLLNRVEH